MEKKGSEMTEEKLLLLPLPWTEQMSSVRGSDFTEMDRL
jgi:hypothetical protein